MADPTLIIHWLFSAVALVIMAVRLGSKRYLHQSFNLGDYLTMGAIFCTLARAAIIHVVLLWGSNNIPPSERETMVFTAPLVYRLTVGSQLTLANRVFYNTYLWLQKLVMLDLSRRIVEHMSWSRAAMWVYGVVLAASYVVVQVVTFCECHPIRLYWQVTPDPGGCQEAQLQLIVLGVLNIVTDAMLLVLPLPALYMVRATWRRKTQLAVLFGLGLFIILITLVRLPLNATTPHSQDNRTAWASTELLTAAAVVNAASIYGMWNKRHQEVKTERSRQSKYLERVSHMYGVGGGGSSGGRTNNRLSRIPSHGPEGDAFDEAVDGFDMELEVAPGGVVKTRQGAGWTKRHSDLLMASRRSDGRGSLKEWPLPPRTV